MDYSIEGTPGFAFVHVDLAPGEKLVSEASAMASMSAELPMKATFNGGLCSGVVKRFLGGESMFVNRYENTAREERRVTLTTRVPGDIRAREMNNETFYLQSGAFLAATEGIKLGVSYAGFGSLLLHEGLFRLKVSGTGTVFYGAFGGLLEKQIKGQYVIDTGHLVGFDPSLRLKIGMAGGVLSSVFGGEGLVARLEGNGTAIIQTRSVDGLVGWLNPKLR